MMPAALLPSSPAERLTHYEVQVRHGNRWMIEVVSTERDAAQDLATRLMRRWPVDGVRVVKEIFDPVAGRASGCVIFTQERASPSPPAEATAEAPEAASSAIPVLPSRGALGAHGRSARRGDLSTGLSIVLAAVAAAGVTVGMLLR